MLNPKLVLSIIVGLILGMSLIIIIDNFFGTEFLIDLFRGPRRRIVTSAFISIVFIILLILIQKNNQFIFIPLILVGLLIGYFVPQNHIVQVISGLTFPLMIVLLIGIIREKKH